MKTSYFEQDKRIDFVVTDENNSLIVITDYLGKVTMLTQFYDFDIEYLKKYYLEKCSSIDEMVNLFI